MNRAGIPFSIPFGGYGQKDVPTFLELAVGFGSHLASRDQTLEARLGGFRV